MATRESARGDIATRWVELIVALLFVLCGAIAIVDSLRVGITWAEDGPRAGYFPFYIGCLLALAGGIVAVQTLLRWQKLAGDTFVIARAAETGVPHAVPVDRVTSS